ncbi:hypothetical protein ACQCU1_21805 [Sutcliffiella horikoshii]|uniref:hypothetical protein n=1 Tax=Sutcliffiella horikoshii TaxID=79883 RepID=UPI003CF498C3
MKDSLLYWGIFGVIFFVLYLLLVQLWEMLVIPFFGIGTIADAAGLMLTFLIIVPLALWSTEKITKRLKG